MRRDASPRLDLRPINRALETFGRRSLDALLPEALQSERFVDWTPTVDASTLAIGRGAWEQMTLNEYRSQVGFTDLLHAMTRLGLSRDSLQTMERLTRDEVVHVELCRRMVVAEPRGAKQRHSRRDGDVSRGARCAHCRGDHPGVSCGGIFR
jgi:hypothetical protein